MPYIPHTDAHICSIPDGLPPQRKSIPGYNTQTNNQSDSFKHYSVPSDIRNLTLDSGASSIWSESATSSSSSSTPDDSESTAYGTKAYYAALYAAGPTEDDSHRVYVGPCTCPYYCRHHPEIEVERCKKRCECTNWCWYHQGVVDMISRHGIKLVLQRQREALWARRFENLSEEEKRDIKLGVPQPTMRELAVMLAENGWKFDTSEVFRWQ